MIAQPNSKIIISIPKGMSILTIGIPFYFISSLLDHVIIFCHPDHTVFYIGRPITFFSIINYNFLPLKILKAYKVLKTVEPAYRIKIKKAIHP